MSNDEVPRTSPTCFPLGPSGTASITRDVDDSRVPILLVVTADGDALVRSGPVRILGAVRRIEVVVTGDGVGAVVAIHAAGAEVVLLGIRMSRVDELRIFSSWLEDPSPPIFAMLKTRTTGECDVDVQRVIVPLSNIASRACVGIAPIGEHAVAEIFDVV